MQDDLKNEFGITLVELMVVIAIIAILAGIGTFSIDSVRRERLSSATRSLLADLQKARSDAMTSGPTSSIPNMRGGGIRFSSATSYVVFTFNDSITNFGYDDVSEEKNAQTVDLGSSVNLSILVGGALVAPAPGNNVLIFDHFGLPRQFDWCQISDMTVALTFSGLSGYTKCLRVLTNSIKEGFWDGTTCNEQ